MDEADLAGDRIEIETKRYLDAIDKAIKRDAERLPATGFCHYCGEHAPPNRSFCSKDCAMDFQHEKKRKKEMGQ